MNNKNDIKQIFGLALSSHQNNRIDEAIDYYNQVLNLDHNNFISLNNLGIIYHQKKEIEKSIDHFKKTIDINPDYPPAHENLKIIYFNQGKLDQSLDHDIKFLKLRSKFTKTKANLENLIPKLAKKLQNQNHVRTFFDNMILKQIFNLNNSNVDYCEIFEKSEQSKENRFISYSERLELTSNFTNNRLYEGLPFLLSQGTHSLVKWKNIPIFKTTYDFSIYMMIINDIKPDYIIELGSGLGGSAIWFADITKSLGLKTKIISFDILKPDIKHPNINFVQQDLNNIDELKKSVNWDNLNGKKMLIEDAHVNVLDILNFFNNILQKDDYVIIEDSLDKETSIKKFINNNNDKYKIDQFYLDFFGINISCCVNSIFKCF